jgi:hypothetical protein
LGLFLHSSLTSHFSLRILMIPVLRFTSAFMLCSNPRRVRFSPPGL